MSNGQLSRPIIETPLNVTGRAVAIHGHWTGAEIVIRRYDENQFLDPDPIGRRLQAPDRDRFNVGLDDYLRPGHRIFAIQRVGNDESSVPLWSQADEVGPMPPLEPPRFPTPLHICAKAVKVGNLENGTQVKLYKRKVGEGDDSWELIGSAYTGYRNFTFGLRDPLEPEDELMAIQSFIDVDSHESDHVEVLPYPEEQLPPPTILGRSLEDGRVVLPECATSFEVAGTDEEIGATLYIYQTQDPIPIAIETSLGSRTSVHPESPLVGGWDLVAEQELCGPEDRSDRSDPPVTVMGIEDYLDAFPPNILRSRGPEGDIIEVQGAHESTIRIIGDGVVIGGGRCYGRTRLQLDSPVHELADNIKVSMSFECNGEEMTVESKVVPVADLLASEPLTQAERDELLEAHNAWREQYADRGVEPLRWSDELADHAQFWANHLAVTGLTGTPADHSQSPYGENIHGVTGGSETATDVVKGWCDDEQRMYVDGLGEPEIDIHSTWIDDVWHFTQVVWSGTSEMGGARARFEDREVWVCNYEPGGNIDGEWPYST